MPEEEKDDDDDDDNDDDVFGKPVKIRNSKQPLGAWNLFNKFYTKMYPIVYEGHPHNMMIDGYLLQEHVLRKYNSYAKDPVLKKLFEFLHHSRMN
jgi:hypothetical protein